MTLIVILVARATYSNPLQIYSGLAYFLSPSWGKMLSISLWIRAITDTVLSMNLGFGVITFLSSSNPHKMNCFKYYIFFFFFPKKKKQTKQTLIYRCPLTRSSVVLATFHTITLGFMLLLSCSASSTIIEMGSNQTELILEAISSEVNEQYPPGEGWKIIFFVAVFLLSELFIVICFVFFSLAG